ncbi:regulator of chromosome condensation 1/beta-lactamase-inhibitor protein II [Fomes fomentarius]|nr:regulator of chromosome condensation 1/beta-lactamase-inhibitor protein II [Fomes fomentarius]
MPSLSLLSAGSNARGQLATGDTEDAHHFTPCTFAGYAQGGLPEYVVAIEQVACGANHTLVLLRTKDGTTELWGCGDGSRGQLGPSLEKDEGDSAAAVFRLIDLRLSDVGEDVGGGYTVRLVAAGWETSYIVLSRPNHSDLLLSMGGNDFGTLGIGASGSSIEHGLHVVELGKHLPDNLRPDASILYVLTLSAGPHHVIAQVRLTNPDGTFQTYLLGWGTARHGQLGCMPTSQSKRPISFTPSPQYIPISISEDISSIVLGNQHTVYLQRSSNISGMGSNRKDQLSGLDTLHDVAQVGCTWNGTYALLCSGTVLSTGSNTHSQLGRWCARATRYPAPVEFPSSHGTVERLVCGSEHVLCIVKSPTPDPRKSEGKEVWAWGWNEHGNLGLGGTQDANVPTRIWPPQPPSSGDQPPEPETAAREDRTSPGAVVNVWAGCATSWILVER